MNFSTDLPKGNPLVTYIVASAIKAESKAHKDPKPSFRMHAVVLKKERNFSKKVEDQIKLNEGKGLILCHTRKATEENEKVRPKMKRKRTTLPADIHSGSVIEKEDITIDKKHFTSFTQNDAIMTGNKVATEKREDKNFANSKRLMKVIEEHTKESYSELYVLLFRNVT